MEHVGLEPTTYCLQSKGRPKKLAEKQAFFIQPVRRQPKMQPTRHKYRLTLPNC